MKLYLNDDLQNLDDLIEDNKQKLQSQSLVVINTLDYRIHSAAYLAWQEVGGNILVLNATLPELIANDLISKAQEKSKNSTKSISFHSSGTTGNPKLLVMSEKQFNRNNELMTKAFNMNSDTKINMWIPAFSAGFWFIALAPAVLHNAIIYLSSFAELNSNTVLKGNFLAIVPGQVDQLAYRNVKLDLSGFSTIITGASKIFPRHVEYLLQNKASHTDDFYGGSDSAFPVFTKKSYQSEDAGLFSLNDVVDGTEVKIVDGEVWIKGDTTCDNFKDYGHYGDWYKTGDLWKVNEDGRLESNGRTNDVMKVNGFSCNLSMIENVAELEAGLGESLAEVRNTAGTDWVELFYTNKQKVINRKELYEVMGKFLSKNDLPRKFTLVDSIPKSALSKKVRHHSKKVV